MTGRAELVVRSSSVHRVLDKLAREQIRVLGARRTGKNEIALQVAFKDGKKAFAILQGSCYNVVKVRERGLALFYKKCLARAGLLVGAFLFVAAVVFFQHRVLRIEVVGSGAYYEREAVLLLEEEGVGRFSPFPKDFSAFKAKLLSLPRVGFCTVRCAGGVLIVEIGVNDDSPVLAPLPLLAPLAGRVEEIVVLRGTPCVQAGDEVEEGQTLAEPFSLFGEERRETVVIARARLSYPVSAEYAGGEEEALLKAQLDFGQLTEVKLERTEHGFSVTGRAERSVAINLE